MGNSLIKDASTVADEVLNEIMVAIKRDDFNELRSLIVNLHVPLETLNHTNLKGMTVLAWVSIYNRVRIAKFLLNEIPEMDVNAPARKGMRPLGFAATFGHLPIAECYLDRENININAIDENGQSPIFYAVQNKNYDMTELFLKDSRLDRTVKDTHGLTILEFAKYIGDTDIISLIQNHFRDIEIFQFEDETIQQRLDTIGLNLDEIPELFIDDISTNIMSDPRLLKSGHILDRSTIERLANGSPTFTNPFTKEILSTSEELERKTIWKFKYEIEKFTAEKESQHQKITLPSEKKHIEETIATLADSVFRRLTDYRDNLSEIKLDDDIGTKILENKLTCLDEMLTFKDTLTSNEEPRIFLERFTTLWMNARVTLLKRHFQDSLIVMGLFKDSSENLIKEIDDILNQIKNTVLRKHIIINRNAQ